MKKPIILITPSKNGNTFNLRSHYTSALIELGAVPLVMPYTTDESLLKSYCDMADGMLFSGGIDIDPKYYGEERLSETVEICRARDEFELELFRSFYITEKPILAICRGMQLVNVALGGTLNQDIPGHKQNGERWDTPYRANVRKDSRMYSIVQRTELEINSFHHQSVKDAAPSLVITANATEDGCIEAFESKEDRFLIGVQWHPEDFYRQDDSAERLFTAFIEESSKEK